MVPLDSSQKGLGAVEKESNGPERKLPKEEKYRREQ